MERGDQVIGERRAGYVVYWRRVYLRAERGFNYLREVGERWKEARDRNWRIGGCVLAKGEEAFRLRAEPRRATTIVSLCLDVISRIEMQTRCRRIHSAASAYL
jgi:hypothetical protein